MTIWLLALLLVASLAGLGYRQGAIRVSFSLVGIFVGALLAVPLARPMAVVLKAFSVTNPVVLWLVPPLIAFCVISGIFKAIALAVHHKVEVHFKYKAGDLRLSLWERLNRRVGLCLGIVNGVAYLVLISFVIYIFSYWTIQMESSDGMSRTAQLLNRAGKELQSTGFIKTARALDRMPSDYYEAADVVGLLYQNPLLEARLSRYPAFLMLGESPEFQALANDAQFVEMRTRQASLSELLTYAPVTTITGNPATLQNIWGIAKPDLKDLMEFLKTGQSQKYSEEPILGRWNYNVRATVAALRRSKPNISATEMQRIRISMQALYAKTRLIMGTGEQLVVKDYPNLRAAAAPGTPLEMQSAQGTWSGANGNYHLGFSIGGADMNPSCVVEGDRMTLTLDKTTIVFDREI
jgi:hypothetical protein